MPRGRAGHSQPKPNYHTYFGPMQRVLGVPLWMMIAGRATLPPEPYRAVFAPVPPEDWAPSMREADEVFDALESGAKQVPATPSAIWAAFSWGMSTVRVERGVAHLEGRRSVTHSLDFPWRKVNLNSEEGVKECLLHGTWERTLRRLSNDPHHLGACPSCFPEIVHGLTGVTAEHTRRR